MFHFSLHVEADTPAELVAKVQAALLKTTLIQPLVVGQNAETPAPESAKPARTRKEKPADPPAQAPAETAAAPAEPAAPTTSAPAAPSEDPAELRTKIRATLTPVTATNKAGVTGLLSGYGGSVSACPVDKLSELLTKAKELAA